MSEQPREQDMLARLADAFVEQAVPAGPSESVKERLKSTLEQRSKRLAVFQPVSTWRGSTMQKVMSIAAVLAVIAIGALVATRPGNSGSAFAAMIDRINEIRTVRFDMRSEVKDANEDAHFLSTVTLAKPWARFESTVDGQKMIRITNANDGKTLTLFENSKKAKLGSSKGRPALSDLVDKLRNLPKQGAEFLGKESAGGVEALKYRQETKGDYYTVWIDPATNLPVQMTIADALKPSATTTSATLSNFQWDVPVDQSQLTLEVPAGYEVTPGAEK
jgi:outer membrane lipoprotein-sorting protein